MIFAVARGQGRLPKLLVWISSLRACFGYHSHSQCEGVSPMCLTRSQVTTLLSAVDEIDGRKQLTDEEFAALKERVKEQGAVVKASKEARAPCLPAANAGCLSMCCGRPGKRVAATCVCRGSGFILGGFSHCNNSSIGS